MAINGLTMISLKKSASTLMLMAVMSSTANSAIYLSHDSTSPSVSQQLSIEQIRASKAQTEAITQLMQHQVRMQEINEERAREDRIRNNATLDKIIEQRVQQHKSAIKIHEDRVELDQERIALQKDIDKERRTLLEQGIKLQQDISLKELALTEKYNEAKLSLIENKNRDLRLIAYKQKLLNEEKAKLQKEADQAFELKQKQILAEQKTLAQRTKDILTASSDNNRPSNVKVIESEYLKNIRTAKETRTASLTPPLTVNNKRVKTNLVDLLDKIVPTGWRVVAPNNLLTIDTAVVKGDWEKIIDTLAVMHPYLTFTKDFYSKKLLLSADKEALKLTRSSSKVWKVNKGNSLRQVITDWSKEANYDLLWKAGDIDFEIEANGRFIGTFEGKDGVLAQLLKGTEKSKNPLMPDFKYGNNVLIILPKLGFKQ
ncbi:TcpQ domain-containing protein [Photobacterium leiognathi]|uniref:TcpQ domain-containing protein n=1 Tax=Photobacterium leiognathi TaxID=553611 RepID=UPI002980A860|nr:TcpQ domain-containing protein [Photobacterium leiognathi]